MAANFDVVVEVVIVVVVVIVAVVVVVVVIVVVVVFVGLSVRTTRFMLRFDNLLYNNSYVIS